MKVFGLILLVFLLMAGAGFVGNFAGLQEGYNNGYAEADQRYTAGYNNGYADGDRDGYDDGWNDGYDLGWYEGGFASARSIGQDISNLANEYPNPYDFAVEVFTYLIGVEETIQATTGG